MLTKEITKGMEVRLKSGFRAIVQDNMRNGSTRLCEVFGAEQGFFDETGSVYATDIVSVNVNGVWTKVELTDKQRKSLVARSFAGF